MPTFELILSPEPGGGGDAHASKVPSAYNDGSVQMFVGIPSKLGDETAMFLRFRLPGGNPLPSDLTVPKWKLDIFGSVRAGPELKIRIGLLIDDGRWNPAAGGFRSPEDYADSGTLPFGTADGTDVITPDKLLVDTFLGSEAVGGKQIQTDDTWLFRHNKIGAGYADINESLAESSGPIRAWFAAQKTTIAFTFDPFDPDDSSSGTTINFTSQDNAEPTIRPLLFITYEVPDRIGKIVPLGSSVESAIQTVGVGG